MGSMPTRRRSRMLSALPVRATATIAAQPVCTENPSAPARGDDPADATRTRIVLPSDGSPGPGLRRCADSVNTTLFRPVGVRELQLVLRSGARAFPPRLPEQPFF